MLVSNLVLFVSGCYSFFFYYVRFYSTNIVIQKREKTETNLTQTIFCLYCSKSNFFLSKFDSNNFLFVMQ